MKIAVLVHPLDDYAGMDYGVEFLIPKWRAMGHDVFVTTDLALARRADAVVAHGDLTVTPMRVRRALDGHPRVINRGLWDISKRKWSGQLLARGDGWAGPVIIKTDLNCFGAPERIHFSRAGRLTRLRRALGLRLPGGARRWARDFGPYQILDRLTDVPAWVWREPALVVERYLPERDGDANIARYAWILGDRGFQFIGRRPRGEIKGPATDDWRVSDDPLPREVAELIRARRIDYAKIDFTITDGRANVIDVNRTPTARLLPRSHPGKLEWLAEGLTAVLARF